MKKYIIQIIILFLSGSTGLVAQDFHYSQLYQAPMSINPAMTGLHNEQFQVGAIYRNQYRSVLSGNSFQTMELFGDYKPKCTKADYWSIGSRLLADRAGEAAYSHYQWDAFLAFHKLLFRQNNTKPDYIHYLSGGLNMGIIQRRVSIANLIFDDQWNSVDGFQTPGTSAEQIEFPNRLTWDIGTGFALSGFLNGWAYNLGWSFQHLQRPDVGFFEEDVSLYNRHVVHFSLIPPNSASAGKYFFSIVPQAAFMKQGPSVQYLGGVSIDMDANGLNDDRYGFRIGGAMRFSNRFDDSILTDAVFVVIQTNYKRNTLGLSYDFNVSPLVIASGARGSFEISYTYRGGKNDKCSGFSCPDF